VLPAAFSGLEIVPVTSLPCPNASTIAAFFSAIVKFFWTSATASSTLLVYVGNKFIGYVQEKGYSKGDEVIDATEEVVVTPEYEIPVETSIEEQDKAILAPDDMNTPDDDESFTFGLARSAELPNNVTQEQIDEAKKWWDNSPLSKFVSIEHMANIVNSNAFARFVASGKKLATPGTLAKIEINKAANGNYVDVYHEAWHAFSQSFLTK